jgi:hypothetical protein
MIEYVDPIPPVRSLLDSLMDERVYGNSFPTSPVLPALLVKSAGGVIILEFSCYLGLIMIIKQ